MQKLLVMVLLGIGISGIAGAMVQPAPEIDPASGTSALALLGGAVLMIRGRRKSR